MSTQNMDTVSSDELMYVGRRSVDDAVHVILRDGFGWTDECLIMSELEQIDEQKFLASLSTLLLI